MNTLPQNQRITQPSQRSGKNSPVMKIHLLLLTTTVLLLSTCTPAPTPAQTKITTPSGKTLHPDTLTSHLLHLKDSLKIPALSLTISSTDNPLFTLTTGVRNQVLGDSINPATLFEAASLTKPLFALAVLQLEAEGRLDLDEPLADILPHPDLDDTDDRGRQITARMVLSHTSGLPGWRKDSLFFVGTPGEAFQYSGEAFEYLGLVVTELVGEPLHEFLGRTILDPAGMVHSTFIENEATRTNMAIGHEDGKVSGRYENELAFPAYGLRTTAQDYARFVQLLMNSPLLERMVEPQRELPTGDQIALGIFRNETNYGPRYYHSGNNGNRYSGKVEIYPEHDFAYVLLTNSGDAEAFVAELLAYLGL